MNADCPFVCTVRATMASVAILGKMIVHSIQTMFTQL